MAQTYLDFLIDIGVGDGLVYPIAVRSPAGEARTTSPFAFTDAELENHLLRVENALLRGTGQRRTILTPEEDAVRTFGQRLFDFLLTGEPRSLYYECLREAHHQGKGVRVKLSIQPPLLVALPWEFLYDPRKKDYICLEPNTPLVRYTELAQTVAPLPVTPPLRILGMVAAPTDLPRLDVAQEQQRVAAALQRLQARGLVELTWLDGQTWRDLQQIMRPGYGPWHIFHFIGHGRFDDQRDEGRLALADDQGRADLKSATQIARLLANQRGSLRLVLLNSCEGARGGKLDPFSSTAATLIQSGVPAVLAMQYAITNAAAVEFARTFYEALADNLPVDAAVADARNAINFQDEYSLEWGTPVLYMRAVDGRLFVSEPLKSKNEYSTTVSETQPVADDPRWANVLQIRTTSERWGKLDNEPSLGKIVYPSTMIEFDWVTIPASEFWMGSDKQKDTDAFDSELPQHRLSLPEYRIARGPVTVAQFEQFVKATKYVTTAEMQGSAWGWTGEKWEEIKGAYWAHPRGPKSDVKQKANHPVTCVSWYDASAFCQWVNVRLPTEAEWERAARGTDGRVYPWGNEASNPKRCNFDMNVMDTTPVGQYPKGVYDLFDMVGNVWEWTSTKWLDNYQDYASKVDNELAGGDRRVVRGGSWFNQPPSVRAAVRYRYYPDYRSDRVGFRVVLVSLSS